MSGALIKAVSDVGGGKHMKLGLEKNGKRFDCIFFSMSANRAEAAEGDPVDVAFYLRVNEYKGSRTVQLQLADIRPSGPSEQEAAEMEIYEKHKSGAGLTAAEAESLLPPREDFVAVWHYLKNNAKSSVLEDGRIRLLRRIARAMSGQKAITRPMVCLDVFEECGLIEICADGQAMRVYIKEITGKVNLDRSNILTVLSGIKTEGTGVTKWKPS
jgi:single-stranded-DNA-specific exonuclease